MGFRAERIRSLVDNTSQNTTDADVTEKTLATFSVLANTLAANGDKLRIVAYGTRISSTNADVIRIKFGGTTLLTISIAEAGATAWHGEAILVRTGAATQKASAFEHGRLAGVTFGPTYTTPAETLTGAVNIVVTGQNGAAVDNSLVFEGLHVTWEAAAP